MPEPEFSLTEDIQELDIFPSSNLGRQPTSVLQKEILIALRSQRTGEPIELIRQQVEALGEEFFSHSARRDAAFSVDSEFNIKATEAIRETLLQDIIEADNERSIGLEVAANTIVPEEVATVFSGNAFERKTAISTSRVFGLLKLIEEETASEEVSVGSIATDILDMFITIPFDALRLGGFKRTEQAQELRRLISAEIPDKQFYARAREIIKDAADAGILTESNFFFFSAITANLIEGGEGEAGKAEEFFNLVDLAGIPGFARGATNVVRMLKNSTTSTAALRNPEAGTRVLADGVAQPGTVVAEVAGVARETSVSVVRPLENGGAHTVMVAAGAAISQTLERTNTIFKIIRDAPFFRDVDPSVFSAWLPTGRRRLSEVIEKQQRRRVNNLVVEQDSLSNIIGTVVFGRTDGMPFKSIEAAERFADDVSGRVVPLPFVGEPRFSVTLQKNLSREGLVDALDANEVGQSFFRAFGGTFLSVPDRLLSLAQFGESALSGVAAKVGRILERDIKAAGREQSRIVDQVFYSLRDGERLGHRRVALNIHEFRTEFAVHSKGHVAPTKAAEDLYFTIQELNDALYFLKADVEFKRVVEQGSEVLQFSLIRQNGDVDDISMVVKGVSKDELTGETLVFNPLSGQEIKVSELGKGDRVFRVAGDGYRLGDRTAEFIIGESSNLRRVYHSDVLGYNPGGPRNYEGQFSHIVKQRTTHTMLDGSTVTGRDRSFILARSSEEAHGAAEEINNIFKAFRGVVSNLENLTLARAFDTVATLAGRESLEAIVKANTRWNTSIESIEDLVLFMRKQELDPRVNVGVAAKDEALAVLDDAGRPIFGARIGETYDDTVTRALNQPRNGPRRDDPLLAFGKGEIAETISPLDLIQNDFMRVTHAKAFQAFHFRAVNGWLEGAQDFITPAGKEAIQGLDPIAAMKVDSKTLFGRNPGKEGRSFIASKDAILRVLGSKTELEIKWNDMINRFGEFLYDKKWKWLSKVLRNSKLAKTPLEFLRSMVFDARLGLLDPGQLIVQSSQSFNILAIIGTRRGGEWLQAMASHLPLRLAMRTDDPATIREIGRRAGAWIGMDVDEFVDWVRWSKDISRLRVGEEAIEIAGRNLTLARSFGRRVRTGSRAFFNEGEKVPRSAGLHVAWKEFKAEFPKGDPFSEHGKQFITSRQNALTAAMTTVNRAAWQRGPMSIPLQFMTYSSRMMESLFTNRLLTVAERKRLATAQVVFWGAAGTGLGPVLDGYLLEAGIEIDDTQHRLMRYGALDAALQWSTGTQAVFGGRLAMAEGFSDLIGNATQGNFLEVVSGPGGQLINDVGLQLIQGFGDIANGRTSLIKADIKKLVRNFTGPNKAYNAWMMFTIGDYLSRNDDVIVSGVTNTDALLHTFGGQMAEANLAFDRINVMQNQDEYLKEHGKKISTMMEVLRSKAESGDFQGALEVQNQVSAAFAILQPWQVNKLRFSLNPQLDSIAESVIQRSVLDRGMSILTSELGGDN